MSQFQDQIPDLITSQQYLINMGPFYNLYEVTGL